MIDALGTIRQGVWLLMATLCWLGTAAALTAQQDDPETTADSASAPRQRHALVVVGLPGDDEHRRLFSELVGKWRGALAERLQVADETLTVLGQEDPASPPTTADRLAERITQLKSRWKPEDTLWVLWLGHGDCDDRHAHFHLPGPDLDERDVGRLFADVACREQVFWMTHACSGWFLKPLSRPGRLVVTATTAEAEINETEFPAALASVLERPDRELDRDGDGRVSVAELFRGVTAEVDARFAADQRLPTEHALLDDNGDGRGTEAARLVEAEPEEPADVETAPDQDGAIAARIFQPPRKSPSVESPPDD